ncbi:phage regulatory CII family protein [Psychrobacter sp. F1192]|uniref:Phage regulatory CII family protein n=1 Tax=Psychrobacter coccoides TaxID=2818440 RepID=A0ABS3NJQ3_9GAMM|nr:phage regulatory CII family protein [Psychrobacter coccoides]MBO1529627.1 phage regulatory CII family protein [Psychrobacter coccoides]
MNVIDAAHKTVHNSKHGGSIALAARMGMSSTVLNNKVNPNTDTHHLRLDEALTIMEFTGDHSIIQSMAQQLGGEFTTSTGTTPQASLLMTALSTSASQGEVMVEMHKALEDGRIDCKEHDLLQTRIQDMIVMLRTLSKQVTEQCEGR